jgi:hypothetical protein
MATPSISSVNVAAGATPTALLAGGDWSFVALYNNSDETIYLDFAGGRGGTVSSSNGIPLPASSDPLILSGSTQPGCSFKQGIKAIHGGAGDKAVAVQAW